MSKSGIVVKRLPTGYYHVRGRGPCEWAQPKYWPASEEEIRSTAFPEASEEFILSAIREADKLLSLLLYGGEPPDLDGYDCGGEPAEAQ